MTDRRFAGLVLIPAAVTVFGVSVAWAAANDPLAAPAQAAQAPAATAPAALPAPVDAAQEQRMADLEVQIEAARARIAELQSVLAARDAASAQGAAASAAPAPPTSAAPRPAPAARPAPAPRPAPSTHVTTKASG